MALTTLRHKRLNYFWPIVEKILTLLEVKINSKKNDIMVRHVMTAILVSIFFERKSQVNLLEKLFTINRTGDTLTNTSTQGPFLWHCLETIGTLDYAVEYRRNETSLV